MTKEILTSDKGSITIITHDGFYEVKDLVSDTNQGFYLMAEALKYCSDDMPIYFTVDVGAENNEFYRKMLETGKVEISHIVLRKKK